jgi:cytochrome c biogenesis protein CcdA/thiol-disulfide isomerase/thioredoxin
MALLLVIAFAAGAITAVTPCILPVLPIILAGGASSETRRRPYAIVAGLVASFTAFTLAASSLLSALHLAQDTLNKIAIGMLLLLAATLVVPKAGELLERPFLFLTRRRTGDLGGGFLLGASLGLVFVPCAGPVLGAVTTLAGSHRVGTRAVFITLAYAIGTALPMLLVAKGGRRISVALRSHQQQIRVAMGVLMAVGAVAIYENWETSLQTAIGSYTNTLQNWIEGNSAAKRELAKLRGQGKPRFTTPADKGKASLASRTSSLPVLGKAPEFAGVSHWLNTPADRPLTLASLRGKVVLVDFWTYSCINCLRTLPHLRALYAEYHRAGLEIVGVHTPEFAFEHVLSNVRRATHDLHVAWPVALDNDYKTWDAYSNQYWPAEYFIDRQGRVRRAHFGEGEYDQSEQAIRSLLGETGHALPRHMTSVADRTPTEATTPETYLGYSRIGDYVGSPIKPGVLAQYTLPASVPQNGLAYGGQWRLENERAVAGLGARLRLHVHARNVYVVLGGQGRVDELVDGKPIGTLRVTSDRLYTVLSGPQVRDGVLELRFSPGIDAYSFTFG